MEEIDTVKVLTHDGRFHTDDVVACELISLLEDNKIHILRTRDLTFVDQYKWVVDVGHQYVPEFNRFDHHQESCKETWSDKYDILLSSSGMVFKHYWKEILEKFGWENATEEEAELVYKTIFLPIDAHDNGQVSTEYYIPWLTSIIQKTHFRDGLKMGQVITNMNHDDVYSNKQMLRFKDAMNYAFDSLCPAISNIIKTNRSNQKMVELLKDENLSSGVLVLPKGGWVNSYILRKIDPHKKLYFTVYEKKVGVWGFSAIQEKRFQNRIDLVQTDYYDDIIFIHKKLFCGSAKSKTTAIFVCLDSIAVHKKKKICQNVVGAGLAGGIIGLYLYFKN